MKVYLYNMNAKKYHNCHTNECLQDRYCWGPETRVAPHHPVSYELHVPWQTSWRMLMVVSLLNLHSLFSSHITRLHLSTLRFGRPADGCSWRCLSLDESPFSLLFISPGYTRASLSLGGRLVVYLLVDVRGGVFP